MFPNYRTIYKKLTLNRMLLEKTVQLKYLKLCYDVKYKN